MSLTNLDPLPNSEALPEADPDTPQGELGWEGHVHFNEDLPLWQRLLETWPELRTGLSYSLIFASGVLLGGAIMAMMTTSKNHQPHS